MNYIVSVVQSPENKDYKYIPVLPSIKIDQLDHKLEADEAKVLVAENLLEFFTPFQEDEILDKLVNKTRLGGELILSVIGGKQVLWRLTENNFQNGNEVLYGSHKHPIRNVCFDIPAFLKKLEGRGLKIIQILEQDGKNIFKCQKLQ